MPVVVLAQTEGRVMKLAVFAAHLNRTAYSGTVVSILMGFAWLTACWLAPGKRWTSGAQGIRPAERGSPLD
jgi:hypothetical protein